MRLMVILALALSALSADAQQAQTARSNAAGMRTAGKLLQQADSPAKISALALADCKLAEDCPWTRWFRIGKAPLKFAVALASKDAAKGTEIDYLLELKDNTDKVVFEAYWSSKIEYIPDQADVIAYDTTLPPALANLKPGRYKYSVTIVSADGTIFDQKDDVVIAQPATRLSGAAMQRQAVTLGEWDGCNTLSSGSDGDPSYLACVATVLNGPSRNSSNAGAFSNLKACLGSKGSAMIAGHGNVGYVCTGNGNSCGQSGDDNVAFDNAAKWLTHAAGIKDKASQLRLLGCNVGQGADGANLLNKLAKATNTTVSAPTGLSWCDPTEKRIWIDGFWRVATPTSPAKAVRAVPKALAPQTSATLKLGPRDVIVPRVQIRLLEARLNRRGREVDVMRQGLKGALLSHIDFKNPTVTDSIPSGVITGRIVIETTQGGTVYRKEFQVLSNLLLKDVEAPDHYYRVDEVLHLQLQRLSRR